MVDAEGFDPALLAKCQRDEKPKLDQLGNGEMFMEFPPESVIGDLGVPGNSAGIRQRDFLALRELGGIGKV